MSIKTSTNIRVLPAVLLAVSLLAGCGGNAATTPTTEPPTAVPTDAPPTATPEPLAARVNGEGILLEDFNIELKNMQLALQQSGEALTADEIYARVLDDLIANTLLAQAAAKAGQTFDQVAIQARADNLASQMGGADKLTAWKQAMGYSDTAFLRALARGAGAAWQRDQIMSTVPETAEQVHARQILVQDEATANGIMEQLKAGTDFSSLARQYDPATGGELGWFPRGFLFQPEVEEAAFSTEPGTISGVVHSAVGFHIVFVVEKDPARALGPEARSSLQKASLAAWLDQNIKNSTIERLIP